MSPEGAPRAATRSSAETVTICHVSDLHLPLTAPLRLRDLLGKRLLGAANLRFHRAATHQLHPLEAVLGQVRREDADLVLITGDLVNLSLPAEFVEAEQHLRRFGLGPGGTVVIPGNHDRYTPGADWGRAFEGVFGAWRPPGSEPSGWPAVGVVGPIVLIALDTARWRGPVRAAGRIGSRQLEAVRIALDDAYARHLHPVIALHHPPLPLVGGAFRQYRDGLQDQRQLLAVIGDRPCTLLHGHAHVLTHTRRSAVEIFGVSSASSNAGVPRRQAALNRYTFSAAGLAEAVTVRWWPESGDEGERFERETIV